jgi:parallel beta-helix repeat protein
MKKIFVGIVLCVLMSASIIVPVSTTVATKTPSYSLTSGTILYVGGSGPGNYTTIQEAIDAATDGDTVSVYDDSSPYYEALRINHSISLIGEEKHTTILDGGNLNNISVVNISADGVVVQGFTIQNGSWTLWSSEGNGIVIGANHVRITDNIIRDNNAGIMLGELLLNSSFIVEANHCVIEDNDIYQNTEGIDFLFGSYCRVSYNRISYNNYEGVSINSLSTGNLITCNNITKNDGMGILMSYTVNNTILKNNIVENAQGGFVLMDSNKNSILQNNIYHNGIRNVWTDSILLDILITKRRPFDNTWDGNYWGRAHQLPKPVFGFIFFLLPSLILSLYLQPFKLLQFLRYGNASFYLLIPLGLFMVRFDWHPAAEPYVIPDGR